VGKSVFSTSDGLTVTASLYRAPPDAVAKADAAATPDADRKVLARFSVTGDDKAKAEADRLQARLAGWTYQLGAWKQKSLVPSLDDLKAPAPAAASAGAAPAAPSIATPAAPSFASPGTPPGMPSIVNPNAPAAPPPTAPTAPSSTAPAAGSTPPQATAGTGTKP
jgi:hypothetical protein